MKPPGRQTSFYFLILIVIAGAVFASDPMMPDPELRADLQHRRSAIEKEIGSNSILIVFSTPEKNKTNDVDYPYRQQNNLYYLTGITQPDTTLVLFPGNSKRKEFLFISDRDPRRESWTGKILSHDEAKAISGIENVYSNKQWETFVDSVLQGNGFDVDRYNPSHEYDEFFDVLRKGDARVYLVFEKRPGLNGDLTPEYVFANKLKERFFNVSVKDAWPTLLHMRQVKSEYETKMLHRAVDISCDAHLAAWKAAKPGLWEYQMQSALEAVYKSNNAEWGYPSIVASGPNATTLHYEASQRQMQSGDLLLIDAGAEYNYYTADVTRTFPINGKFTPEQAAIYQIVLDAQEACFKMARPGVKLPDVHLKSVEVIKEGLKKLGLITDTTGDQYKMFYLHGVGHWLGLDVHDAGERWRPAEPGTVFTLEPGIYIRADALDNLEKTPENQKLIAAIRPAFEKYKNIGVRIEDDVLITKTGYENLSAKLPRKIEDIENFLGKR
jgi:Xaa-Pro aminopeptidase